MQRRTLIIIVVLVVMVIGLGLGLGLGFGLKSGRSNSEQSQTTAYVYNENALIPVKWDANMCQAYITECNNNIAKGLLPSDALAGCNEIAKSHQCTIPTQ